jgi:hypothetical protein
MRLIGESIPFCLISLFHRLFRCSGALVYTALIKADPPRIQAKCLDFRLLSLTIEALL